MGKLIIIAVVILAIFGLLKIIVLRRKRKKLFSNFKKRTRVLNDSEHALFANLQRTLGNQYIILSKVRIEDFVEVANKESLQREDHWGLRSRIKSRHVDFLICNRTTTAPLLAIELDGGSHFSLHRQKRDEFIDKLYDAISLPVKHIPVGSNFDNEAKNIAEILSHLSI